MAGLRERKKAATRLAIRDAGMRLFDERGFGGTTVDDIADAAGVSRATVFTYFATKEEIVFGDAAAAVDALGGAAARAATGRPSPPSAAWLAELTGWLEPELLLQRGSPTRRPPSPRAGCSSGAIEDVIAAALEAELGPEQQLAARLTAASLMDAALKRRRADGRCAHGARRPRARAGGDRRASSTTRSPSPRAGWRRCAPAAATRARAGAGAACPVAGVVRRRRLHGADRSPGLRNRWYSMIEIWIAAATGIARRAPSTPNRVEPKSTEEQDHERMGPPRPAPGCAAG